MQAVPENRILPPKVAASLTGLSRATLYRLSQAGEFPPRVKLSANRVGWSRAAVEAWIEARLDPQRTGAA